MAQDAITAQAEIAKLRFQLARYRRAEFGRSSEKLEREAEQLELAIEALETDQAERIAAASPVVAAAIEAQKPARRPLPEHLPREEVVHPAPCSCPTCGGALRRIGEETTETLDYVPGRFKGDPAYPREAVVPILRYGRRGAGARSRDWPRSRRSGAPCPYRRVEVRRPLAALSAGRDLRSRGRQPGDFDHVRLGRRDRRSLGAAHRRARCRRYSFGHLARRRYAGAGVGAGHGECYPFSRANSDCVQWAFSSVRHTFIASRSEFPTTRSTRSRGYVYA